MNKTEMKNTLYSLNFSATNTYLDNTKFST